MPPQETHVPPGRAGQLQGELENCFIRLPSEGFYCPPVLEVLVLCYLCSLNRIAGVVVVLSSRHAGEGFHVIIGSCSRAEAGCREQKWRK